jgi:hypothetical protein
MYSKKKPWRVRVYRKVEDFVEVRADTAEEAVELAKILPNIVHVFDKSAIPADRPLASTDPRGVLGDDEDD